MYRIDDVPLLDEKGELNDVYIDSQHTDDIGAANTNIADTGEVTFIFLNSSLNITSVLIYIFIFLPLCSLCNVVDAVLAIL